MNIAIVVALALSYFGISQADATFAIGIGVFILVSAIKMVLEAVQSLLDRQLPEEELETIRNVAMSVEGVLGVHQLRTRMSGPVRFIQLHLELEDNMLLIKAHEISDKVEEALIDLFPQADVLIHQDPYSVVYASEKGQKELGW
jgi:ferrous-iron efflux pump FieF